jgi:hypothetical protein
MNRLYEVRLEVRLEVRRSRRAAQKDAVVRRRMRKAWG